jgi:hypothetical protein
MPDCKCATDWRAIPKERRVFLEEPGAVVRQGGTIHKDASKVHVFDRDCPIHGYKEILND